VPGNTRSPCKFFKKIFGIRDFARSCFMAWLTMPIFYLVISGGLVFFFNEVFGLCFGWGLCLGYLRIFVD